MDVSNLAIAEKFLLIEEKMESLIPAFMIIQNFFDNEVCRISILG